MGQACDAFSACCAFVSLLIGVCVLVFAYAPNKAANAGYMPGECYTAPGNVFERQCRVSRPGCWDCYESCWDAFYGVYAVPGIISYFYLGTYLDKQAAYDAINYQINAPYGTCYYQPGGYSIIFQLADEQGPLIAGVVFMGLFGITVALWTVVCLCDRKKYCGPRGEAAGATTTETDRLVVPSTGSINTI